MRTKPGAIDRKLRETLEHKPYLLPALATLARRRKAQGWRTYSIYSLVEEARRLRPVEGRSSAFEIDNNLRSRLARELMSRHPDLDGFFLVRALRHNRGVPREEWTGWETAGAAG